MAGVCNGGHNQWPECVAVHHIAPKIMQNHKNIKKGGDLQSHELVSASSYDPHLILSVENQRLYGYIHIKFLIIIWFQ